MVRIAAVDFGTTSSVVAYVDGVGPAELLQHGTTTRVPSAVFWDRGHLLAGAPAVNAAARAPGSFEPTPKRQISSGERVLPFDEAVRVDRAVTEVIRAVTGGLAARDGIRWVATHPVAWSSGPMAVLRAGFTGAGIDVAAWVPEPVAAAWRVIPADRRVLGGRYAVFDWGGGTFDAAVLSWDGAEFTVEAHAGDERLGGEDVDDALLAHILERLPPEVAGRLRSSTEPQDLHARQLLRRDVQDLKHQLSRVTSAPLTVVDRVAGEQRLVVSRHDLDQLAAPFVERCVAVLRTCLSGADVALGQLSGVFLTGDASRLTLTATRLRQEFPGVELQLPVDAKGVVALGAADFVASGPTGPRADRAGAADVRRTGTEGRRAAATEATAPGADGTTGAGRPEPDPGTGAGRPEPKRRIAGRPEPNPDTGAGSPELDRLVVVQRPRLVTGLHRVTAMHAASGVDRWDSTSGMVLWGADDQEVHVTWHQPPVAHEVSGEPVDLSASGSGARVSPVRAVLGADDGRRIEAAVHGSEVSTSVEVRGGSALGRRRVLDANLRASSRTWVDAVGGGAEVRADGVATLVSAWTRVSWGSGTRAPGRRAPHVVAAAHVVVGAAADRSDGSALAEVAASFGVSPTEWSEVDEADVVLAGGRAALRGYRQRDKLVVVADVAGPEGPIAQAWVCLVHGSAQSTSPVRTCEPLVRTIVHVPGLMEAGADRPTVDPGGEVGGPVRQTGATQHLDGGGVDGTEPSDPPRDHVPTDRPIPPRDELDRRYTKAGLSALAEELRIRVPLKATKKQLLDVFDEVRRSGIRVLRYEPPDLTGLAKAWSAGVRRSTPLLAEPAVVEQLVRHHLAKQVGARSVLVAGTAPLRLTFQSSTAPVVFHAVTILPAGEASHVVWDAGSPTAGWLERRRLNSPAMHQVLSDTVSQLVDWLVTNAPNAAPSVQVTQPLRTQPPPPRMPPPPG